MEQIEINGKFYNSYATHQEADEYLLIMYGRDNWKALDCFTKDKLLITATRTINSVDWLGTKVDEEQDGAFPRYISGKLSDERLIKQACIEEAYALFESGNSDTSNVEGISSIKVQDTQITFQSNSQELPFKSNIVNDMLKVYMRQGVRVLY